jgi:hypothetical protein
MKKRGFTLYVYVSNSYTYEILLQTFRTAHRLALISNEIRRHIPHQRAQLVSSDLNSPYLRTSDYDIHQTYKLLSPNKYRGYSIEQSLNRIGRITIHHLSLMPH